MRKSGRGNHRKYINSGMLKSSNSSRNNCLIKGWWSRIEISTRRAQQTSSVQEHLILKEPFNFKAQLRTQFINNLSYTDLWAQSLRPSFDPTCQPMTNFLKLYPRDISTAKPNYLKIYSINQSSRSKMYSNSNNLFPTSYLFKASSAIRPMTAKREARAIQRRNTIKLR